MTTEDAKSRMLEECEAQFRFYAEQHRAKVARWQTELDACQIKLVRNDLQARIDDTLIKATVNEGFANRCAAAREL